MKLKSKIVFIAGFFVIALTVFFFIKIVAAPGPDVTLKEIRPSSGDIRLTVSTTGTVEPKNRLELMPSVAGRIDKIFVKEGDRVRKGQILVLMSSTDRAALLDAARLQGAEALKYWQDAYKPIPIVAPIYGTVIVRSVEPGQTVTTADDIIVISDRLIVKAQVDETDIGRVVVGQSVSISLDSHPDITVRGRVTHISYESTTVSNVTVYYVEITPVRVPLEFRSGMSASVEIIEQERKNIILIPCESLINEGDRHFVMIKKGERAKPEKREITPGLSNEENVEVKEGISMGDVILLFNRKIAPADSTSGKNPFMPERPRRKRR